MFNIVDTRESVSSKNKITRIITPFFPFYTLPFFQCFLYRHFHGFLKTRVEITGELKSGTDESSEMVPETSSDSGSGLSELLCSGLLLTSASVIEAAGPITTSSDI
jgi:hypothetical protein